MRWMHQKQRWKKMNSDEYGLKVFGSSSSTIQLVSPLTKEIASTDNGGGGNWGAELGGAGINQIETIVGTVIFLVLVL